MFRFIAASLLLLPGAAIAAGGTISVSAGEHDDYSRIAFSTDDDTPFVQQKDRRVRVYNIDQSALYTLDEINIFRKAYRVAGAKIIQTESGKALEIVLNCDCTARANISHTGKFYIDIYETKASKPLAPGADVPVPQTGKTAKNHSSLAADRLSVEQARQQMVALLEQAAEEGLVTIKGADPAETESGGAPANLNREGSPNIHDRRPDAAPSVGKAVQDKSRSTPGVAAGSTEEKSELRCLPDSAFALEGEDFDKEPLVQIATLQAQLADAKGAAAREVMHHLVKGYLSIGFGEEALGVLIDYDESDSLYADMARVIAEREPQSDSALAYAQNCSGAHALWQAAAVDVEDIEKQYVKSNGALLQLPKRLRAVIATRLALKTIAAEAWPTTKELHDIAQAASGHPTPELLYIKARLDEQDGNTQTSRDSLLDIASHNSDASDEAALALAESYLDGKSEPYPGFTEDIGAIAKMHPSTKVALIEAKAWAELGNIEAALFLLRSVADKSPDDITLVRDRAISIIDRAISSADPRQQLSALDAVLLHKDWLALPSIAPDRIIKFARLAREYGLPNLSYFLASQSPREDGAALSYERALAALSADMLEDAIRNSAPYTEDSRFREILVKAELAGGQYHAALANAAALPDPEQKAALTARAGWFARSWGSAVRAFKNLDPNLFDENAALRYALAAYMAQESSLPPVVEAMFSNSNSHVAAGLQSLFSSSSKDSALERSRQSVDSASQEIIMIEEVLSDG